MARRPRAPKRCRQLARDITGLPDAAGDDRPLASRDHRHGPVELLIECDCPQRRRLHLKHLLSKCPKLAAHAKSRCYAKRPRRPNASALALMEGVAPATPRMERSARQAG